MSNVKYEFVVMVCYYGEGGCRPHRECIEELKRAGIPFMPVYDCPYLDIARSYACTAALEQCPEARGLIFIDHDMHGFTPNDVIGFAQRAIEAKKDVVGIGYSLRRPGFMLACQPLEKKEITFNVPGYELAKYVGTGFTFLSRETLEGINVGEHFVHCVDRVVRMFFAPWIDETGYHPDDIGFCYRVRDTGRKIWIDTQMRIFHRGSYDYAIEDSGLSVPNMTGPLTVRFEK
jgi:hypothetical protein